MREAEPAAANISEWLPTGGSSKQKEDAVDAIISAYTAAYFWLSFATFSWHAKIPCRRLHRLEPMRLS